MPAILRELPFYDRATTIEVQGRRYPVQGYQIVVWVSLSFYGLQELDPRTPRFPAVLDTGFTDTFLIHEQHLREFAGLRLSHLPRVPGAFHVRGRTIPVHAGNVWLHANKPGARDEFSPRRPFFIEIPWGVGVCSDAEVYPRFPLLGNRALRRAELQLSIDYRNCRVSLRTASRFRLFGW
jgi:hypothetical protein